MPVRSSDNRQGMRGGAVLLAATAVAVAASFTAAAAASPAAPVPSPAWQEGWMLDAAAIREVLADAVPFVTTQLAAIAALDLPPGLYPNGTDWTHKSGFLCGCLFKAYALMGDPRWAELAANQLEGLELDSYDDRLTHDFVSSFGEALAADVPGAPVERYQRVLQKAAAAWAKRYNAKVGAMCSWGRTDEEDEFKVIIDSMASLHLMPLAAALPGGQREWADIGAAHAATVAANHFRGDSSTYHLVIFDPKTGERTWRGTHQGYADNSTWARQAARGDSRHKAWAAFGFAQYHEASGDRAALATARTAADYYLQRMEEAQDLVPLWDLGVPASANQPWVQSWKDSSAAAIAAAGLLRLGLLAGEPHYTAAGLRITQALTRRYLARPTTPGPALASVLRNGTWSAPAGNFATGLIWGDYFYLNALVLLQRLAEGADGAGAPPPTPAPAPAPTGQL
ncbi:hypothetical protein ABPG75_005371 [Micractinium tetrahymenae]